MDINSINNGTSNLKPVQDSQKTQAEEPSCCSKKKFSDVLTSAENAQSQTNQTPPSEK